MQFKSESGPPGDRSDAAHRHAATVAAVETALAYADGLDGAAIQVSVDDGVVVLEGVAQSHEEIGRAMEIAVAVVGGFVRNRIWCGH